MKKLFLALSMGLISLMASGQCYDYSSTAGWTFVDLTTSSGTIVPYGGSPRVDISGGTFNFYNAPDGNNDVRGYTRLNKALCESWIVDFDFKITGYGTGSKVIGYLPFAVSSDNQNASAYINPATTSTANPNTDNDAIGVWLSDGSASGGTDMVIEPYYKNGTSRTLPGATNSACQIPVDKDTLYHVTMERIDNTRGRLTVYKNSEIIGECCFDIDDEVSDLIYLQHSNNPTGDDYRKVTGFIDNTCIQDCKKLENCCNDDGIMGPDSVCYGSDSVVFSVNGNADDYDWSVGGGGTIVSGDGTNTIVVDLSGASGNVEIVLTYTCGCDEIELIKQVTIRPDLTSDADFIHGAINYPGVGTEITGDATASAGGLIHTWEVYEAEDCDGGNMVIKDEGTAAMLLLASGTGTTFTKSGLDPEKCYITVHTVCYGDGSCCVEKRKKAQSTARIGNVNQGSELNPVGAEGDNPTFNDGALNATPQKKEGGSSILKGSDVKVYPNPTNLKILNVEIEGAKGFTGRVYNMQGQLLLEQKCDGAECILNMEGISSGTYLLKVETASGKLYNETISVVD